MVNSVILIGRLTRDIDLQYLTTGTAKGNLSLAVNRRVKKGDKWEEEANFFDIEVWGKTAESLSQYLVKGKLIAVEGELRQNTWEKDGQKRSKVIVTAQNIQLLSKE